MARCSPAQTSSSSLSHRSQGPAETQTPRPPQRPAAPVRAPRQASAANKPGSLQGKLLEGDAVAGLLFLRFTSRIRSSPASAALLHYLYAQQLMLELAGPSLLSLSSACAGE